MGRKRERHEALVELLESRALCSQAEVCEALAERGISTTQGTVSRDLDELGAVRGRPPLALADHIRSELATSEARSVYYLPPDARQRSREQAAARLDAVLREHAIAVEPVSQTPYLLVRTQPGRTLRVARALVASEIEQLVAALPVPGDRVLVLVMSEIFTDRVAARLAAALPGIPAPQSSDDSQAVA